MLLLLVGRTAFALNAAMWHSKVQSPGRREAKIERFAKRKPVPTGKGFGASPPCVCGSGRASSKCCTTLSDVKVRREQKPSTIVRSRYSAYARGDHEYIMDTTHPDNSSFEEDRNKWRKALADQPYDDYKFVGVDILDESVEEQEASVTFVAKLKHKKTKQRADFQEKSFFQLDADTGWLYLGGDVMNAPLVDLKTGADRTDEQDALIGGD